MAWQRVPLIAASTLLLTMPWPVRAGVSLISSDAAQGISARPAVTRQATAGNFLFALVTVNGNTACRPASGWTALPQGSRLIVNHITYCSFYKARASGRDRYAFGIDASLPWTLAVAEFSGIDATAPVRSSQVSFESSATPTAVADVSSRGDLVIAGLADSYEGGGLTVPMDWAALTPNGAGRLHYGTPYLMMGALAWRVAQGGAQSAR